MQIINDESKIEILVPVTRYYSHIFVFGLSSVVMIIGIILYILSAIFGFATPFDLNIFGYLIVCPLITMYALWLINGTEKIILDGKKLILIRSNGIIQISKIYETNQIHNLRLRKRKYPTESFLDTRRERIREKQRAFPFWYKMGKIEFDYQDKNITILNGLNQLNAQVVLKHLTKNVA